MVRLVTAVAPVEVIPSLQGPQQILHGRIAAHFLEHMGQVVRTDVHGLAHALKRDRLHVVPVYVVLDAAAEDMRRIGRYLLRPARTLGHGEDGDE